MKFAMDSCNTHNNTRAHFKADPIFPAHSFSPVDMVPAKAPDLALKRKIKKVPTLQLSWKKYKEFC
jgi:hypothetical protein